MNRAEQLHSSSEETAPTTGMSLGGQVLGAAVGFLVVPVGVIVGWLWPGVDLGSGFSWWGVIGLSAAVMVVALLICTYLYRFLFRVGVRSWLARFISGLITVAVMANHFSQVFTPWWGATLASVASTILLMIWVSLEARDERLSAPDARPLEP